MSNTRPRMRHSRPIKEKREQHVVEFPDDVLEVLSTILSPEALGPSSKHSEFVWEACKVDCLRKIRQFIEGQKRIKEHRA